ncbi:MAG TPA: hypothetical protein VEB64_02740 [Azospirillaceae bacterium]|nr:hypothetical protein [Azospirillaceae bacterium]
MSETQRVQAPNAKPEHQVLDDRLTRRVTVEHPDMKGAVRTFEAFVEKVFYRAEDGERELAFRGLAQSGNWSGYKTFFAADCVKLIDHATGTHIDSPADWLLSLKSSPSTASLGELVEAMRGALDNEIGVSFEGYSVEQREGRVRVELAGVSSVYEGEIDPTFDRLFFDVATAISADGAVVVGSEPIALEVYDAEPSVTQHAHYVETVSPLPVVAFIAVPCEAGRIDIRKFGRR